MNNLFPINAPLTVVWHLSKPDGSDFSLQGYDYRLFYKTGKGKTEVASTAVTADGNTISFVFPADAQRFPGQYSLQLLIYQNGKIFCDVNYQNAFAFSRFDAAPQPSQNQEADNRVVHLYTVAEYYLLAPVIPVVGSDGYWYVNGSKAIDGTGEYIPASHTLEYDEATDNLIIDRGRVDSHGQSIEQVVTAIAEAAAAEVIREENETHRIATEAHMQDLIDNIVVNFLADSDLYERAVEQGYQGTRDEWLVSTLGVKGLGIATWDINQSTVDSGVTRHTITLNDSDRPGGPTVYTFDVKNGKGIASVTTNESAADSGTNVVTFNFSDETSKSFNVKNGRGISSMQQTTTSSQDGGTNVVTVTFSDGSTATFQFKNGSKGNPGSSVAYPFELENSLTSTATDTALTAAQGKVLNEGTLHLGTVVETLS